MLAPAYDRVRFFSSQHRRSIGLLDLVAGERVLMVGAGPAHDLSFVPEGVRVLVTDVAPGMIARARRHGRAGVDYAVMDGAHLDLADGARPGLLRRAVNVFSRVVATDLNRRFGDILNAAAAPVTVVRDEPAAFGDFFRILILREHDKPGA